MSTTDRTCECGCGQTPSLATQTNTALGHVKGRPVRFRLGHSAGRFAGHIEEDRGYETPCWIWQGGRGADGYGLTRHGTASNRKAQGAHRFYYQREYGPLPDSLDLHHRCEVRLCVNPTHLEPTTEAEHLRHHATLTWDAVRDIRSRFQPRVVTRKMLAAQYGVSVSAIKKVLAGTVWSE